jgi:hypothetical protein
MNRVFALAAVERVFARKLAADEYDLAAKPAVRRAQIDKLEKTLLER